MSLDPSAFPRSISPASSDSSLTRSRLRGKEGLRPTIYTPGYCDFMSGEMDGSDKD